jgi:hypothetical protein
MYFLFILIIPSVVSKPSMDLLQEACRNIMNEMQYINKGFCYTSITHKTETFCIEEKEFVSIIGGIAIYYLLFWGIYLFCKRIYEICFN